MFKRKPESDLIGTDKNQKLGSSSEDRRVTFVRHLKALNEQFAAWVQEQAHDHVTELWSDGVEDYLQHAKKLLQDFEDVVAADGQQAVKPAPSPVPAAASGRLLNNPRMKCAGFAFGALPGSKPPLAPGFPSSSQVAAAGAAAAAPAFAALPSISAGFNFGAAPATAGMFKVPSVHSTGTLGTGTSGTTLGGATTADEEEGEEEGQPEEPSVALEPSDADILLKQRVKLMSMVGEGAQRRWKDKGAGTLTLRRAKGEAAAGKQPYLVFTTDSGRVLINAPLVRGMKPTCNPKTPTNVAMFLVSNVEGEEQRGMHLFKCADVGAAKEMNEKVLEYV